MGKDKAVPSSPLFVMTLSPALFKELIGEVFCVVFFFPTVEDVKKEKANTQPEKP